MNYNLLELKEGMIKFYIYADGRMKLYKLHGEESQEYDSEKFWDWWMSKTQSEEPNLFIIINDERKIEIPSSVNIATEDIVDASILKGILSTYVKNSNYVIYPNVDSLSLTSSIKVYKEKSVPIPERGSIADFFQSQDMILD